MRNINQKYVITMIAAVCTIVFTPYLYAQNKSDSPNMPATAASGRSIGEFLTPDGRFDLETARRKGFQGSLNVNGLESGIDTATGQPVFRPAASASPAEHPDDIYWDNSMSSSIPGFNGYVFALTMYDGKLIAGGGFSLAGGVASANNIAAWDGSSWSLLGSGMGGGKYPYVFALTVYDGKLIAGGRFGTAGGVEAYNITSWDGSSWSPLGSGIDFSVLALTVYDGKLIAGGDFDTAGGVEAKYIAAWDGSSWSPLGSGMDDDNYYPEVHALKVYDGKLIAGGRFTTAGGVEAYAIAAWDGSSWSPLGSGMDAGDYPYVYALTVYDGKLIAGGWFTTAGIVEVNRVAAWDGSSWSPLGSGMDDWVFALTVYDRKLIAGGQFTIAGGKVAPYITSWTKKDVPTEVEQLSLLSMFRLSQNYPNPFNPATTIGYAVPSQSRIILTLYNVLGQSVRTLVDETRQAGSYRVTWDGTDQFGAPVSMGVYFYRLQAGDHSETKKMLLLK